MLLLTNHAGAGDRLFLGLWHPDLSAAHRAGVIHRLIPTAARLVDLLAAIAVPVPPTRSLHAAVTVIIWTLLNDRSPLTTTDVNGFTFNDWLADGVADVLVTRFRTRLVSRVAFFTVAGLVDWLADVVADSLVAGLVARFADGVAFRAIAGPCVGHTDGVRLTAVSSFLNRFANGVWYIFVAHLINRLLHLEALVPELCFIHVAGAGDRDLFTNGVIHGFIPGYLTLVVNDILDCLVLGAARGCCSAIVARG